MSNVNLTINGKAVSVPAGSTILDAAKKLNINIPTLCYCDKLGCGVSNHPASCRICVVEVEKRRNLAPACATPVMEGMVVHTNSLRALNARRTVLELILSDHPQKCLTCAKNQDCELQQLTAEFGIRDIQYEGARNNFKVDTSSEAIMRDLSKCIMCRRCETVCNKVQTVGALTGYGRGFKAKVGTASLIPLADTNCTFCGQCVNVCPVGAITGISYVKKVWQAINDPTKTVIVSTAPAVRVAIGQEFGFEPGTPVTGKLVAGLRALGFDKVFDTNFAADLTIMEEGNELVGRIKNGKNLPILTSCCPGWINFIEHNFPDLLDIPSSCKSPQQMFGAIAKSYYAQKIGVKPEDLIVVSVMPCQAKKYEAARPEFAPNGVRDIDYVVTTRELCKMFREAGVNLANLEDDKYDSPLGESTGAADIFGVTGGVLEAALRSVYFMLNGKNLEGDAINFRAVRGLDGVKEARVQVTPELAVNVAVASGLGNARKVLEMVRKDRNRFQAIEIMACPGGCINGGGQPYLHGDAALLEKRMKGLYTEDERKTLRLSHENPDIQTLYKEFLGEPGSEKAHHLLHTVYHEK
ncbi:MAG: 2Fe-2S iron-sulfur cluster binding domain-containing protein [Lentisphaerae bacterium]|nr:2Fe-2S iron-sulfur cluster binding domain-containing protein [Lentisphaerota bacterium]